MIPNSASNVLGNAASLVVAGAVQATFLVTTVVIFFVALLLLSSSRGGTPENRALRSWGIATLLGGIGLVLLGIGADPRHSSTTTLGVAALLAATGLSWSASRLFTELKPRFVQAMAGPLIWVLGSIAIPSTTVWAAAACMIGAAYTLSATVELWRIDAADLPSRQPAIALQLVHSGVYVVRAVLTLGAPMIVGEPETLQLFLLEGLLHAVGLTFFLQALARERSERRAVQAAQELAFVDSLTGLANRRRFEERYAEELGRARRERQPIAIILIDVDHFKAFNDAHGHQRGDECLHAVAQALTGIARRSGEFVARYGGEEFCALLPGTDALEAVERAEAMRAAVVEMDIPHVSPFGRVTISLGVSSLNVSSHTTGKSLLREADLALYAAKAAGRNTVRSSSLAFLCRLQLPSYSAEATFDR